MRLPCASRIPFTCIALRTPSNPTAHRQFSNDISYKNAIVVPSWVYGPPMYLLFFESFGIFRLLPNPLCLPLCSQDLRLAFILLRLEALGFLLRLRFLFRPHCLSTPGKIQSVESSQHITRESSIQGRGVFCIVVPNTHTPTKRGKTQLSQASQGRTTPGLLVE